MSNNQLDKIKLFVDAVGNPKKYLMDFRTRKDRGLAIIFIVLNVLALLLLAAAVFIKNWIAIPFNVVGLFFFFIPSVLTRKAFGNAQIDKEAALNSMWNEGIEEWDSTKKYLRKKIVEEHYSIKMPNNNIFNFIIVFAISVTLTGLLDIFKIGGNVVMFAYIIFLFYYLYKQIRLSIAPSELEMILLTLQEMKRCESKNNYKPKRTFG